MRSALNPILFATPRWRAGASLAFDFTINRAWLGGSLTTADALLTTTRASDAYADNNAGEWSVFASNIPRITNKGLLAEEARTNLFLNSGSPATQNITVVAASVYTVSVVGTGSVTLSDAGSGTASQGSPVTFTAGSTTLTCTTAGITGAFPNVNVELGAFATSPIRTTGVSAARAADAITVNNFSSWYNQSAGSIYINAVLDRTVSGANAFLADFTDGTANESILAMVANSAVFQTQIADGGVTQAAPNGGVQSAGTAFKYATAYAVNDARIALNGASIGTPDTSLTLPTVDRVHLGARFNGTFNVNGRLRRFAYKPTADSTTTLQALTT